MADGAPLKVALLARAGEAREQLRRALGEFGAELVVEADPNELDAARLSGSGATTVLVSIEPAVEAAIERLDDALLAPGVTVLYDEAETTAQLQGWDLNRWARHLAAKLMGKDVLPPGAEAEPHQEAAEHLVAAVLPTPSSLAASARIEDFAGEVSALAAEVPSAYSPSDAPEPPVAASEGSEEAMDASSWAAPPVAEGDPESLGLDKAALAMALETPAVNPAREAAVPATVDEFALDEAIDLSGLELIDDPVAEPPHAAGSSVSLLAAKEISFDAAAMDVEEITLSEAELAAFGMDHPVAFTAVADAPVEADGETLAMDEDLVKLAAAFDENLESVTFEAVSEDLELASEPPFAEAGARVEPPPVPDFDFAEGALAAPPKAAAALPDTSHLGLGGDDAPLAEAPVAKPAFDFSGLSLELAPVDDLPAVAAPPPAPIAPPPGLDVGHLSLAPLAEETAASGAAVRTVLVLSGIGGPDAVRQLVRALPAGFPGAVLLKQNLDGGRHDRFVEQLAKISRLPVALAEPHETPPGNAVRVLPDGSSAAGALRFPKEGGIAALVEAVAALDGAIVVLSGADEAAIEPVKAAMAGGLRVLVQDPSSCFDAKAASLLREAGAPAVPATDLAARLDAYFSS